MKKEKGSREVDLKDKIPRLTRQYLKNGFYCKRLRNSSEDKVYVFKDKYFRQMKRNPKKNAIDNKESHRGWGGQPWRLCSAPSLYRGGDWGRELAVTGVWSPIWGAGFGFLGPSQLCPPRPEGRLLSCSLFVSELPCLCGPLHSPSFG